MSCSAGNCFGVFIGIGGNLGGGDGGGWGARESPAPVPLAFFLARKTSPQADRTARMVLQRGACAACLRARHGGGGHMRGGVRGRGGVVCCLAGVVVCCVRIGGAHPASVLGVQRCIQPAGGIRVAMTIMAAMTTKAANPALIDKKLPLFCY